jgi:hypothetical protein
VPVLASALRGSSLSAGPAKPPQLPISTLHRAYSLARQMSQEERLEFARWLTGKPRILDQWSKRSTARYARRFRNDEPYKFDREPLDGTVAEIRTGRDVEVALAAGRRRTWRVSGDADYDFRFVEYQLPPLQTKGGAKWENGAPAKKVMTADLLLCASDGTPVVGEVKAATGTGHDTDPVMALIQGLTLAAQLATPSQMARLAASYGRVGIRAVEKPDLYILVVRPEVPARARFQARLYDASRRLAAVAQRQPHLPCRRIAFVEVRWSGKLELSLAPPVEEAVQ